MAEERRMRDVHLHAVYGRAAELLAELEREPALLEARDGGGSTPLHWAADSGHAECVGLLLARGADRSPENDYRNTPLHWAAYNGHLEAARLLVAAGADLFRRNKYGRTPLDDARSENERDVAAYLEGEMKVSGRPPAPSAPRPRRGAVGGAGEGAGAAGGQGRVRADADALRCVGRPCGVRGAAAGEGRRQKP